MRSQFSACLRVPPARRALITVFFAIGDTLWTSKRLKEAGSRSAATTRRAPGSASSISAASRQLPDVRFRAQMAIAREMGRPACLARVINHTTLTFVAPAAASSSSQSVASSICVWTASIASCSCASSTSRASFAVPTCSASGALMTIWLCFFQNSPNFFLPRSLTHCTLSASSTAGVPSSITFASAVIASQLASPIALEGVFHMIPASPCRASSHAPPFSGADATVCSTSAPGSASPAITKTAVKMHRAARSHVPPWLLASTALSSAAISLPFSRRWATPAYRLWLRRSVTSSKVDMSDSLYGSYPDFVVFSSCIFSWRVSMCASTSISPVGNAAASIRVARRSSPERSSPIL
mmetsp:Transcript_14117/g.32209  ORF Transcript_14117/g.32209 Transcript_14117/m.32209 type:complete len:354 (+) Transcript_14117:425-1486(+)